ncbi:MAG: hypothetical protein IT168_21245 [Bryobacterales bacterium]|nr:hypothetical protein [Bryobacterales bacterium]
MTDRERILAAISGQLPDRLPWAPRLDFWWRAHLHNGTLPSEMRSLDLVQLADYLGVAAYSVIPDFTATSDDPLDMIDYAIGIFRLPILPFLAELEDVDRRVTRRGREITVDYHTPVGSIQTVTVVTDEMLEGGASVPWRSKHAIQTVKDMEVVGYIFSHTKVTPRYDGYLRERGRIGDRGIVIGYVGGSACPMHHILRELMTEEQFFYALHDEPAAVERLVEQMEPYYAHIKDAAANSPAELVLLGGNYDDAITSPPFFRKHILPALRTYADALHAKGKYLMTHTDGENRRLIPLYLEAGFDVADSVCPAPMTRCTLDDLTTAFDGRIAIWGGIPSVLLCKSSASDGEFRTYIDNLVERYRGRTRLILGVSDMVTADCEWDRLQYITERLGRS